ncbi:metallopeptidase family m24 domain-containing protein [Trichoderma breve]|uniref:Xaa-Pro aminopeptidase n=1 Tax=Trichoderma breve TaxID=2034170 RepID=A0A9W9BFH4_9HYPO|nr:metallopeptidase family m24 domain-containing protein [Trichoderma breve]KAJ4858626.1 metallopeptidase family m24 domain-containing protein [Trichoderma breve]
MRLPRPSFRSLGLPPRKLPLHQQQQRSISQATFKYQRPSYIFSPRQRYSSLVSAANLQFGQPVHETHPHILKAGEVTPGISAQEYADRRAALADAMPEGGVAVLHAAPLVYKSGAVFHPYRQETNFLWLTGWDEPDAMAIIEKTGPKWGDYLFRMFVKAKNPREEQWSGYRNGVQAAQDVWNADEAWSMDRIDSVLPKLLESAKLIYTDVESAKATNSSLWRFITGNASGSGPAKTPLYPIMNKLRVIKSPAEVTNMRMAGQISGRAITNAMRRSWVKEKDLHAFLDYEFTINGCDGPAYIPVIAGGQRANCIHYTVNNNIFRDDEFILVDAGGQYGTYITDISRTWPASGKFSAAQRDLYEAVLKVQRSSVSLCRESARMSLEDIHGVTVRGLVDQLKSIGFTNLTMSNIDQLFPHHVGHYIGLDVHDCPGYSRREILRQGHCVTIEPGVYVPDDERWPAHFRGMGIRIEDSICVDEDAPYILTTEAVKEIDDIEALRD